MLRPGMRAYLFPLVAGVALGVERLSALGCRRRDLARRRSGYDRAVDRRTRRAAALLATLSLITRKNSRHPLLLIGLVALGIMFLSWRIMPRTISSRVLTRSQAVAIVDGAPVGPVPPVGVGYGMYVGLGASLVLVAFGLTIVIKRVSRPVRRVGRRRRRRVAAACGS